MKARDRLADVLGAQFADIIIASPPETVEDGVHMGLDMAVQTLEATATRVSSGVQKVALFGCADILREISAGLSLEDSTA